MRATGKMTFSTDMARKFGQTIQDMRENTTRARNMVKEPMFGQTGADTRAIGLRTELKAMAPTLG